MKNSKAENSKTLLATRAISSVILALRRHGVSAREVSRICEDAMQSIPQGPTASAEIESHKDSATIGTALAMWFRDSKFLDASGLPRPLRASGRAPSINSLLLASGVEVPRKRVIDLMLRAGVIRLTRKDN